MASGFRHYWRFLQRPCGEKKEVLGFKWRSFTASLPEIRKPVRLPFGALWIPRRDNLGEPLLSGTFETLEVSFVGQFLKPGMTMLDIGAHHGLYTLLAAKNVKPGGRVFAFEPSARERRFLRLHLILNGVGNVRVEPFALGDENTAADLFVVQGKETGCNSLRPPVVSSGTSPERVFVRRLDDWITERAPNRIDFIKLDAEGAELPILKGAELLLQSSFRPVILVEVQDVRTEPWGYRAREILEFLERRRYRWFRFASDSIKLLDVTASTFEGNFVAWPEEALALAAAYSENRC
jgi:FkbM family methyltransferase